MPEKACSERATHSWFAQGWIARTVQNVWEALLKKIPTYAEIQRCVKQQYGFVPKTCWIAHVKELNGLEPRIASNRLSGRTRQIPCPPDKRKPVEECFRRLGMI
jgi:hypothetical protein